MLVGLFHVITYVVVDEYQVRRPPVNAGHGLQRKMETEFVHTKPEVLQKIRASLQEKKAQPRQVAYMSSKQPAERPSTERGAIW